MQQSRKTRFGISRPVMAGGIILFIIILAAGCLSQSPGPDLGGTSWMLTGYLENGTIVPVLEGTRITLVLGKDDQVSGSAGCNRYSADYSIRGTSITIGQVASTLMYCSMPGVIDQEKAYLRLLGTATSCTSDGVRLSMSDAAGRTVLVFEEAAGPEPEPLIRTNWTLESFHAGDAVSSVIAGSGITAVFGEDGRVQGSAGCNRYFAGFAVNGTAITVSNVGSTKMNCAKDGIMAQEQDYLDRLKRAGRYGIEGDRLVILDSTGRSLLTFRAGA